MSDSVIIHLQNLKSSLASIEHLLDQSNKDPTLTSGDILTLRCYLRVKVSCVIVFYHISFCFNNNYKVHNVITSMYVFIVDGIHALEIFP